MTKQAMVDKVKMLKPNQKIPITYDEAAKMFFSNPNHLEPLAVLLSGVLEEDFDDILKRIKLVTTYIPNNHLGEKKTNRDICLKLLGKTEDELNRKILIEVNDSPNSQQVNIDRNIYYVCEAFSNGLHEDETYDKILPTMLINLNNFFVDKKSKKLFDVYNFKNKEGYEMSDILKIYAINIEKCYKYRYNESEISCSNYYKRNLFYLCGAMVTEKVSEFNELIDRLNIKSDVKKIIKEMSVEMNKNDDFIVRYFDMKKENERINQSMLNAARREGHKSGVSEGIAEGRALGQTEGSKQKEKEMVLNLYNSKIPIETIAKCANISRETVLKIVKAF